MQMRLVPVVALAIAASATVLAGPRQQQQPPPAGQDQQPAFRSTTQTVPIYATVLDAAGRLVPDLTEDQFEIYDNLKQRPVTIFKSDVQPITVVLMLDTSGSMTLNLDFLKVAAEQFVLRMLPDDKARIGSFSDIIRISPTFTGNRDELISILHTDIRFGNPTFLWDAINTSTNAGIPDRRELDLWIQYRPTEGPLKGLRVKTQYSNLWQQGNVRDRQPEFRFIVDYTVLFRPPPSVAKPSFVTK
jgi:hypothetical protein